MTTKDAWIVTRALSWFLNNRSEVEILRALLPGDEERHPAYVAEWVERLRRPNIQFWSFLDHDRQKAFLAAVLADYRISAEEDYQRAEAFHAALTDGGAA